MEMFSNIDDPTFDFLSVYCAGVLDPEQLQELINDIGLDCLPDILGEFVVEVEERHQQILDAQQRSSVVELKAIAHALKGSSGTMGAKEIYRASGCLEAICTNGSWTTISCVADDLIKEIKTAATALGRLVCAPSQRPI